MQIFRLERRLILLFVLIAFLGISSVVTGLRYKDHTQNDIVKLSEALVGEAQHLNLLHELYMAKSSETELLQLQTTNRRIVAMSSALSQGGVLEHLGQSYDVASTEDAAAQEVLARLLADAKALDNTIQTLKKETDLAAGLDTRQKLINSVQVNATKAHKLIGTSFQARRQHLFQIIVIELASIFVLIVVVLWVLKTGFVDPTWRLTDYARDLSRGRVDKEFQFRNTSRLRMMYDHLKAIAHNIQSASQYAHDIGEGKFDTDVSINQDDALGKALTEMSRRLKEVADEEARRNWAINGLATFSDLLRQHQNSTAHELGAAFISDLVKYVGANQGGLFVVNEEDANDRHIEQVATYAYERRRMVEKRLPLGEGLLGQTLLEKDPVYLEEIPGDYVHITSGLGQAVPSYMFMAPVKMNEDVFGVIEIASFGPIEEHKREFLVTIGETLGSTLSSLRMTTQTRKLLETSQVANEELSLKEEQMRQNAEELEATQEELNRKLSELEEETNLSNNIISAINKTNASIEFDLEGNILDVNDMYLSVMGYTKEELIGRNESNLVSQDEQDMQLYGMLWGSLQSGSFMSGEYRRLTKTGKEVWLNGTYNPIFNLAGEPYKVIKFAQFTTEEKERDLDLNSKINAISANFPMIDLDDENRVKSANKTVVELLGMKRLELRNKHIGELIQSAGEEEHDLTEVLKGVREGVASTLTSRLKVEGKEDVYLLTNFTPIHDLSGKVAKVMVLFVDVSTQKKLELELLEKQALLQKSIAQLEDAQLKVNDQKAELETTLDMMNKGALILEMSHEGRLRLLNKGMQEKLGLTEDQVVRNNLRDLLHESVDQESVATFFEGIAARKIVSATFPFKGPEGTKIYLEMTVAPVVVGGGVKKVIGILFDVTSQRSKQSQLESQLQHERIRHLAYRMGSEGEEKVDELLQLLMENVGEDALGDSQALLANDLLPTFFVKANQVDGTNPIAEKLVGTVAGKPLDAVVSFGTKAQQAEAQQQMATGKLFQRAATLQAKGKKKIEGQVLGLPLFSGEGAPLDTMLLFISAV